MSRRRFLVHALLVCGLSALCSVQAVEADDTSGVTTVSWVYALTAVGDSVFAPALAYSSCQPAVLAPAIGANNVCPTPSPSCVAVPLTGCAALFHTGNDGQTWERRLGAGLAALSVVAPTQFLVPPSYPSDPALFAITNNTLVRSDDGGTTFLPTPAVSTSGIPSAAVLPDTLGGTRILVAGAGGNSTIYDDRTRLMSPGPALPSIVGPMTYAGDDQHLVVVSGAATLGTPVPIEDPAGQATIELCVDGAGCSTTLTLPSGEYIHGVMASPHAATDHTVLAWGSHLWLSTDAGATFTTLNLGQYESGGVVQAALGAGPLCQPLCIIAGAQVTLQSTDGGATFSKVGGSVGDVPYNGPFAYTADGHIFAALSTPAAPALLCSADGGQSWAPFC